MRLNNRGNWTLIGLLVVVAIIIVAIGYMYGGGVTTVKSDNKMLDQSSTKKTVVGKAIDTGKSAACRQQLDQIRKGIETYKISSTDGGNPPTFKDIGLGVSNTFYQCPVSGKPYTYDPTTGKVACPTHPQY